MGRIYCFLAVFLACFSVNADELILKDGRKITFRVLRDGGDSVEVQTDDNQNLTFKKDEVKDIKLIQTKAPLTGATFSGDEATKSFAPINILELANVKKDALSGQWKTQGGTLVGVGYPAAHLELQYIPTTEYDIELLAEKTEGEGELLVGLAAEGKRFSADFDGPGAATGIRCIDGKYAYENESGVQMKVFGEKKPRKIVCAVRKDRVVILVDGKEVVNWKADYKRVSIGPSAGAADKKMNLFLAVCNGGFKISKFVLIPKK